MRQLFRELKRRNVYKVAVTYAAVAFVTLQAARLIFPATTLEGLYDKLVVLAFVGLPIALVIAWAFELTPQGVRRTADAEGAPQPESMSRDERSAQSRLAIRVLVGLGLMGAAVAGSWSLMGGGEPSTETAAATDTVPTEPRVGNRSIAVLPFDNLSGTEEAEPFVNGLHDDLLTRLSNISELKVISRTSVLPYRETELTLPAIADSLGVTWIVEGGVQQAGDQVQVNAQLIQAEEDAHKWAETYRRELTTENLFAVQSELTKKIAGSLEAELSPAETERVERRPTEDLVAYRLYVQGRNVLARRTPASIDSARTFFERALRQDSTYALAWAGLADARVLYAAYSSTADDYQETLRAAVADAKQAARRALEHAPDLAEAHTALGEAYFYEQVAEPGHGNGPAALRRFRRAVELKPSYAHAQQWLGDLYKALGRPERARQHLSLAVELDPRHAGAHQVLAMTLLVQGEPERAWEQLQKHPHRPPARIEGLVLYGTGRWDELERLSREQLSRGQAPLQGPAGPGMWEFLLGRIAYIKGDTEGARRHYAEALDTGEPAIRGLVHAALGEVDAAFMAWGEIDHWGHQGELFRYDFFGVMDAVREDPRFRELIREANRAWGLNPDGSLPDSVDLSLDSQTDE